MKKTFLILAVVCLALLIVLPASAGNAGVGPQGKVVIANRGSGTISVIDARTDTLIGTFDLPTDPNPPEPMYVAHSKRTGHVFVGDRANSQVVAFDAADFSVAATIPTGDGVFHMWADQRSQQLWVNNDIDNTATVIDTVALTVTATVPMPPDLVADGFIPHDVILDPQGEFAYITMLGGDSPEDYLVQFSTDTFAEINRAPVGKDPHVSLTNRNNQIFVPAQNSNVLAILNRETLALITEVTVPGAHGVGFSNNGKVFYTTNLPGGGTDGLFAIDTRTKTILGTTDTPYAVPHNIALTRNGTLYLTHSGGTSDKVTIYAVSSADPIPTLIGEVTVGLNPFGLAYIPGP
jgi:DNA-binding beta-propeller fold protein YncE